MDVFTLLIGIVVFIFSALLIWCISAFSMKEKTFEEVMEEQRRQQEEEREKIRAEKRSEKDKHKNKFKKGKGGAKVEKMTPVIEPEVTTEVHKMVQLEIEPEIIEPTESLGLNAAPGSSVRNRGKKDKPGKSILHNKDEKPLVDTKAAELYHKPSAKPKDELELKKKNEKVVKEVVVEKMEMVQSSGTSAAPPQTKDRKSKSEHKENLPPMKMEKKEEIKASTKKSVESAPLNAPRVISFVKSSRLSDNEVQTLIEILLNKQGVSSPAMTEDSWNKKGHKGDSVTLLKKQLEEKEQALVEEKQVSMNANTRMKDIRAELVSEKSKAAASEKQLQDKLIRLKNEMDALQARMQKTHEQHVAETNTLQSRLKQTDQTQAQASDKTALTKITEEKKILEATLSAKIKESTMMADKLKSAEKDLASKVKDADKSKKTLENQLKSQETKLKKLEGDQKEVDALINKRVEEVNQELRKVESKNSGLVSDLDKSNGAMATAQAEVSTLKGKLQELEAHLTKSDVDGKLQTSERKRQELEGNLKNLEKQLAELNKSVTEKNSDIKRLQQENQTLSSENKSVTEKLQTVPATNGDMHADDKHLQVKLDTCASEIEDLKSQLSQQKTKNNELREKNWKAMEALEKAEKASTEKVDKALKSSRENVSENKDLEVHDKAILQRLFPSVKVADKLKHKEWMSSFEKQAAKEKSTNNVLDDKLKSVTEENSKLKSSISEDSKKYSALDSDNKKLKTEVDKYQTIVSETETKLRQLEKSIDSEEKKWQEKLKQCQTGASSQNASNDKVKELNSLISQQEKQISDYRSILVLTEERLQSYEAKITSEEQSWKEKLSSSQSQLQKAQAELNGLESKPDTTKEGSQELQDKIIVLEADLSECKEKIIVLTKEKETNQSELQTVLEQERKKNKELSMNTIKLNGIIKTGHDALTQEQQLVRKLQDQLETKSVASGISEVEESELVPRPVRKNQRKKKASTSKENGTSV